MLMIGNLQIEPPYVMAPIAGYTDSPFRMIARSEGAGLVYTELVSADALIHANKKTLVLMRHSRQERPLVIQLLGKDPETLVRASAAAVDAGADIIDLNLGCPARNVVAHGSGAALLKNPDRVREIVTEMRKAVNVPLTIKIRTGWDEGSKNVLSIVGIANECGVDAIAIHLRTRAQGFKKGIDLQSLVEAVRHSSIPVIGNGDILTPADARNMMDASGCAGVMVGRGALGAPWLFRMIGDYVDRGSFLLPPLSRVREILLEHLDLMASFYGETKGVKLFRKHLVHYSRGGPSSPLRGARHSSDFRAKAVTIDKHVPLIKLINEYFDYLTEVDHVQDKSTHTF